MARRGIRFVGGSLVVALALGLAGCSGGSADDQGAGGTGGSGSCSHGVVGEWRPMAQPSFAPGAASGAWTGAQLLVFRSEGDDWRYDPCDDSWHPVPAGRPSSGHAGVLGSRYVVWSPSSVFTGAPAAGVWLDEQASVWTPMNMTDAPALTAPDGSDSVHVVFGDDTIFSFSSSGLPSVSFTNGRRYDLSADQWRAMSSPSGLEARYYHAQAILGGKLVVWGGLDKSGVGEGTPLGDGAVYDLATDQWKTISSTGAPSPRAGASVVSTGQELVVWGGSSAFSTIGMNEMNDGGVYDPATDMWRSIDAAGAPELVWVHHALWAGGKLVVLGIGNGVVQAGGMWDPVTGAWTAVATDGMPENFEHAGAYVSPSGKVVLAVGMKPSLFDPATNTWTPPPSQGWPPHGALVSAWTGSELIAWGGSEVEYGTPSCQPPYPCDPYPIGTTYFIEGAIFRAE